MIPTWDRRFLDMAKLVASWSRDPSTKVGAVVVRPDKTIASVGFNGLPRGVADTSERLSDRALKYPMTVHAELNAILHAREPLHRFRLYTWPLPPCAPCAGPIIQAGIAEIVAPGTGRNGWAESFALARQMFDEAGVAVRILEEVP
jgi:dCMP deaminase